MKKVLVSLIILLALVSFIGCNGDSPKEEIPEQVEKQDTPPADTRSKIAKAKDSTVSLYNNTIGFLSETPWTSPTDLINVINSYNKLVNSFSKDPQVWSAVKSTLRLSSLQQFGANTTATKSVDDTSLQTAVEGADDNILLGHNLMSEIIPKGRAIIDANNCFKRLVKYDAGEKIKVSIPNIIIVDNIPYETDYDKSENVVDKTVEGTDVKYSLKHPDMYVWSDNTTGTKIKSTVATPSDGKTAIGLSATSVNINGITNTDLKFTNSYYTYSFNCNLSDSPEEQEQYKPIITYSLIKTDGGLNPPILYNTNTNSGSFSISKPGNYTLTITATPTSNTDLYKKKEIIFKYHISDPIDDFTDALEKDAVFELLGALGPILYEYELDKILINFKKIHFVSNYKTTDPALYSLLTREYHLTDGDNAYFVTDLITPLAVNSALYRLESIIKTLSLYTPKDKLYTKLLNVQLEKTDEGLTIKELFDNSDALTKFVEIVYGSKKNKYPSISSIDNTKATINSNIDESKQKTLLKLLNVYNSISDATTLIDNLEIMNTLENIFKDLQTAIVFRDELYNTSESNSGNIYSDKVAKEIKGKIEDIINSFSPIWEDMEEDLNDLKEDLGIDVYNLNPEELAQCLDVMAFYNDTMSKVRNAIRLKVEATI